MHRVIDIHLTGQPRAVHVHEDAAELLRSYLDGARARLGIGPDGDEVIDDLERSIGARLADLAGPADRILEAADVTAVLADVGTVEVGGESGAPARTPSARPMRRRLYRIREGQSIAGVCTGLAAYSDVRLDWVRTIFLALTVLTVGVFLAVYIALAFILPVVDTRTEWLALMREGERATG